MFIDVSQNSLENRPAHRKALSTKHRLKRITEVYRFIVEFKLNNPWIWAVENILGNTVIGSYDKAGQCFVFCILDIFHISDFKDQPFFFLAKNFSYNQFIWNRHIGIAADKNNLLVNVMYWVRVEVFMAVTIHICSYDLWHYDIVFRLSPCCECRV
jgi:hypothetical protein